MIRKRIPRLDDDMIHRLVRTELVPLASGLFPFKRIRKTDIQNRLNQGYTYVATNTLFRPLGFVTFLVQNDQLFIDLLAVKRTSHRMGLGSRLMKKAEKIGRRKGCRVVQLYVDEDNLKAQSFYYKKGYEEIDYAAQIRCYLLSKSL